MSRGHSHKYRVWDKVQGKWVSANVHLSYDGCLFWSLGGREDLLIPQEQQAKYDVQFYTGLKDKNGKESYFDDIVRSDDGSLGVIKWDDKKLRVYFEWDDGKVTYPLGHYDYIDFEIIGNKTDPPELLKTGL